MREVFIDRDAEAKAPAGEPDNEVTVTLRLFAGGEVEADLKAVGGEAFIERCLARSVAAETALLAALGFGAEHVATTYVDKGRVE